MLRLMATGESDGADHTTDENGSHASAICNENENVREILPATETRQMSSGAPEGCRPRPTPEGLALTRMESPPSYEQSMNHRRLEYEPYATGYPAPAQTQTQAQAQAQRQRHQRTVWMTDSVMEPSPGVAEDSMSMVTDRELEETCVRMTLPPMHMSMAITCLILNFLVPGLGTMVAAGGVFCCTRSSEWSHDKKCGSCSLNLCIGLAQLLLTPFLLIGWIWSILWGFAFIGISHQEYHGPKRNSVAPNDIHNVVARGPPAYSELSLRTPTGGAARTSTTDQETVAAVAPSDDNEPAQQQQQQQPQQQQQQQEQNRRQSVVEVHASGRSRPLETGGSSENRRQTTHPRAPVMLAPTCPERIARQTEREISRESHISPDSDTSEVISSTSGRRKDSVTHDQNHRARARASSSSDIPHISD